MIDTFDDDMDELCAVDTVTAYDMGTMTVHVNVRLSVETLATMNMNFDSYGIEEYVKIVGALYRRGLYTYAQKILDLD